MPLGVLAGIVRVCISQNFLHVWDTFLYFRGAVILVPFGGPFGLQVRLLGGLGASKLASLAAWASKLASWVGFSPPSWPSFSDFGLQVGLLGELLASKLAS